MNSTETDDYLAGIHLLAKQLRGCLKYEQPHSLESLLEIQARRAADELERMAVYIKQMDNWKTNGENIISQGGLMAGFSFGKWWGERPWK